MYLLPLPKGYTKSPGDIHLDIWNLYHVNNFLRGLLLRYISGTRLERIVLSNNEQLGITCYITVEPVILYGECGYLGSKKAEYNLIADRVTRIVLNFYHKNKSGDYEKTLTISYEDSLDNILRKISEMQEYSKNFIRENREKGVFYETWLENKGYLCNRKPLFPIRGKPKYIPVIEYILASLCLMKQGEIVITGLRSTINVAPRDILVYPLKYMFSQKLFGVLGEELKVSNKKILNMC